MGRKEIEKLKPLKASTQMLKVKMEDKPVERHIRWENRSVMVYKYYKFFDAAVENGILKVGIWQRCNLYAPGQRPDYTIYIDKEKGSWLTDGPNGWQKAKIINLDLEEQQGEIFGSWNWNTTKALRIVTEYLDMPGATIHEAVRKYQVNSIGTKRYFRNELEKIDEFMEAVPEAPKGFNNDWLIKTAFADMASLMYHPGRNVTEAYCTRCQTTVQIKDKPKHLPKHLKQTICPHCKAKATYRSWGKQKIIDKKRKVGILQKLKGQEDAYCLTRYYIWVIYRKENGYKEPEIRQGRVERFEFRFGFSWTETYEMDEYKRTGVFRWCTARSHGMGASYYIAQPYCVLYEKNLKALFKDTEMKYIDIGKLIKGKTLDIRDLMNNLERNPELYEKLTKAGLKTITLSAATRAYGPPDEICTVAEKLNDILRLDKEKTRLAVKMDCTLEELKVLQAAKMAKINVDEEIVKQITQYTTWDSVDDTAIFLQNKNLHKLLNYLDKVQEQTGTIPAYVKSDYEDYIDQLKFLGIPIDKHSRFPSNFYQVHEELEEQVREKKNKIDKADTRKKNAILKKVVEEIKGKYEVKSKDFMIIWPRSKADFRKEGQRQHNCVGGYYNKCVKKETTVFFLRRKDNPEQPFCTVEFRNGKMMQCRTKYNQEAPEDAMNYMKQIEEHYAKEIANE